MSVKNLCFLCYLMGLWMTGYYASAQLPVSDFAMPSTACFNQKIVFSNLSQDAIRYEWDFCEGDLSQAPSDNIIATLSGATNPEDMDFVYDGVNWYAFVTGLYYANALYRLDFGPSPDNSFPKVTSLGNPGNLLVGPAAIKVVQENGNWYAFITNSRGNSLTRLSFGNSLTNNSPVAEDIVTGLSVAYFSMDIGVSNNNNVIVMSNFNDNNILIINLGSSVTNNPSNSDMLISPAVPGAVGLDDITLVKHQGNWYGFLLGFNTRSVHRLFFGANLFSIPVCTTVNGPAFGPFDRPSGVQIKLDKGKFEGFVQTYSGVMYRMEVGNVTNDNPVNTSVNTLSTLANSVNLKLLKYQSNWYGFVINTNAATVSRVSFPNSCSASQSYSTEFDPPSILFTSGGTYYVSLKASSAQDDAYSGQNLTIQNLPAPDISFSTQNICVNSDVIFLPMNQSGDVSTYQWDFGDGSNSTSANPLHSYSTASTYFPVLTVTATNGCQNFTQGTLQIFNIPQASFVLPTVSPFCTNQDYIYVNTTTYDNGSNPTWQWSVNGLDVTTAQDLNYLFTSSSAQSIMLTASIPGCSTQSVKNITTLLEGPHVSFNAPSTGCQYASVVFTNTTTDPVNGYSWNFGDGQMSSETTLTHEFLTNGNFQVILTANNSSGCTNSFTKTVQITSTPQPNFYIDLPPFSCAGTPTQFHDVTPTLVDGNIASWQWNFNDGGATSTQQNPQHTYSTAGVYNVLLQVETNFGCVSTVQIPIEIAESPKADFTFGASCLNKGTQFQGTSDAAVSAWKWTIDNTVYTFPEPTHTFTFSGTYPATLTVVGVNGCEGLITKNVVIKPTPLLDFNTSVACSGQETVFTDRTTGADLPQMWQWNFESNAMVEGSPAFYSFSTAGAKPVKMTITTQAGCEYSLTKNVLVAQSPMASFTASETFGAPPLDIQFINTSVNASHYSWNFGANNAGSNENSPSFTYAQLGEYLIELTATNGAGCSDVATQSIQVLVPHYNLTLDNLVIQEGLSSTAKIPVVTITNNSNVRIGETDIWVTGSSGLRLKSSVNLNLASSGVKELALPLEIFSTEKFICVELSPVADADLNDNLRCENLIEQPVIVAPYPNPTAGVFWLDIVLETEDPGFLKIADSMGKTVFTQAFENLQQGINRVEIDFSNQAPGLYIAMWNVGGKQTEFRFIRQ